MDYSQPERANRLAVEYVIGTLRGAARRRFEVLLPAHAALRSAVWFWSEELMPLTASIAPVQPPPRVWRRIQTRLAAQGGAPAASSRWASVALWRSWSAVATVAAFSLALLLANPGPAEPPIIVVLEAATPVEAGARPASFIASISADGRALVARPVNVSVQTERALELWAVPTTGAPRSLGLVSAAGATVVRQDQRLQGVAALAVSLEPAGGSPSGAPTGPILYAGKLTL